MLLFGFQGSAHFIRTPSRAGSRRTSRKLLQELTNEINEINPELVKELERIAQGLLYSLYSNILTYSFMAIIYH